MRSVVWPSTRRRPTDTATIATDSVAVSSSTSEDRNARRSTRMEVSRYAAVSSSTRRRWVRARPKTRRVGSPATRSRKKPDSRPSAAICAPVRSRVDIPTRAMNTGTRGTVTATITPLGQSPASRATITASGTTQATTSWGRYREK